MQLNLDQLKHDLCRQMSIIGMIEASQQKAKNIACAPHYTIFGGMAQMIADVKKQNMVTQRLVNYLARLTGRRAA